MPMINDLASLHPYFRDKVAQLTQLVKRKASHLAIVELPHSTKQNEYKTLGLNIPFRCGNLNINMEWRDVVHCRFFAQWDDKALWKKLVSLVKVLVCGGVVVGELYMIRVILNGRVD